MMWCLSVVIPFHLSPSFIIAFTYSIKMFLIAVVSIGFVVVVVTFFPTTIKKKKKATGNVYGTLKT